MDAYQGDLNGKVVFVAGGAGNIGGNLVRGALRAGAVVVTASRSSERFERLQRFAASDGLDMTKLVTLEGDVSSADGAAALSKTIAARTGVPDVVVTSLGGMMERQPLLGMSLETWQDVLYSNLTSHFLTAQAFLPAMITRGSGVYLLVSGYGAMNAWPNGAPVSIAAAGVIGLGRNLAAENESTGVPIATLILATDPKLWSVLSQTPGAYRGEDLGDFFGWLASDAGRDERQSVLYFVTDWHKANAMREA